MMEELFVQFDLNLHVHKKFMLSSDTLYVYIYIYISFGCKINRPKFLLGEPRMRVSVADGTHRRGLREIAMWRYPVKRFRNLVLATEAPVRLRAVDSRTSLTVTLVMNALTIQIKGRQCATTHQLEYA